MSITLNGVTCNKVYFTDTNNGYENVYVPNIRFNNIAVHNGPSIGRILAILDQTEFSQADIMYLMNYSEMFNFSFADYTDKLVGKLVTSLDNSLYSGKYRIIGVNHDGTINTIDLLTEDCVQLASSGFGSSNRHYNDSGCYVRIFAEETFYNAFDSSVKEYIKPMEVKYYYSANTGVTGGTLQTTTAYGKLLSYNEVGTTWASLTSQGDKYQFCQNDGAEGNKYPYFNATGSTLSSLRIKKYNGTAVIWWLRSRYTQYADRAGRINQNGDVDNYYYNGNIHYLAPVIRLGTKHDTDSIVNRESFTYGDITTIIDSDILVGGNAYMYSGKLVGKLVSGLTNSLYSGDYRIIGVNHDGTNNTLDLLTEDCVQQASSGFGSSRQYNDANCYARIFAEETFYNAFDNSIKEYIKPMEVKYYYDTGTNTNGTLQTNTRYGKLLSYNEVGYGISGPSKAAYAPNDIEGELYPYFNNSTTSIRSKKYGAIEAYWWLRSRNTNSTVYVGIIGTNGNAEYNNYIYSAGYLAPVIRLGK